MSGRIIALSGGVGGAKLALGLAKIVHGEDLLVVANTGDDFEHLGYRICPDTDTLLYTLAGIENPETGWGRAGETWSYMERLRRESPEDAWFLLGDKDLETHRFRRAALASGRRLSEITAELAGRFGISVAIVPMSNDPVYTTVEAEMPGGEIRSLPFQDYFVRYRCEPTVRAIEYTGAERARMTPRLRAAFADPVRAVVICPSNPYLSIDPILAVPGLRKSLRDCGAPVVAVSPIVGGKAIKGPTAKLMKELGLKADVASIARHYAGLIDGLVIDHQDESRAGQVESEGMRVRVTQTVMRTLDDRIRLAREVLDFAVG